MKLIIKAQCIITLGSVKQVKFSADVRQRIA